MRLEALSPLVLPEVIGCPHPTLMLHLAMASQRFFMETGAWVVMADEQITTDGLTEYELEPAQDAMVLRVRDAWLDGILLQPAKATTAFERNANAAGYTHYDDRQVIRLEGKPRQGQRLQLRLVMAPKLTSTTIPDAMGMRYQTGIAHGAKATLMVISGQVWTNPQLAGYHQQMFERAVSDARIDAIKDGVDLPLTVTKRRFSY